MKKLYPIYRPLLATFFVLATALFTNAQPAGWAHYMPIAVTENSGATLTDYQVKLIINTQSLIAAGQLNADGSDLRFGPDCAGSIFYPYYIEDAGINTPTTTVWVKVPSLSANAVTNMFMYYGNAGASSLSAVGTVFSGPNSATDSVTGGNTSSVSNSQRGFKFSPNVDVLVTSFGREEPNGTDRYITLFDVATQGIIQQQIVGGPAGEYSYSDLPSPIWLTQGTQYLLEQHQETGDQYYFRSTSQIGEDITYLNMQYCNGCDQNTYPNNTLSNFQYGYPDLWYYTRQQVTPEPTAAFGAGGVAITPSGPTTICPGTTVDLTASGANTYSWSTTETTATITVGAATTYTVTGTDATGCTASASIVIDQYNAPVVDLGGPYVQCGGTVNLDASPIFISYIWNDGITNSEFFTASSTGNYSVTVTDENGCTGASTASVTINTPAPVSITGTTELCPGSTGNLTAATTATSYSWSTGEITSTINVASPGSYSVTVTDGNSCTASATQTVSALGDFTINSSLGNGDNLLPGQRLFRDATPKACGANACPGYAGQAGNYYETYSVVNHGATPICATATITSNCGFEVFGAAYFGSFDPNDVCANYRQDEGSSGSGAFTFDIPAGSTTVLVLNTVNAGNSCGDYTLQVTGISQPVVITPSGPTSFCSYQNVNLTASGASTYVWSTTETTSTITVNTQNTYTVTGTDFNGCTASANQSVTVFSAPVVDLGGPYVQCGGFVLLDPGFYTGGYIWNDGSTNEVKIATTTGTYSVTVTEETGCSGSGSASVTIYTPPTVDLGGPYEQCQGTVLLDAGNPGSSYAWSDGTTTTQTLAAGVTGDYSVTVTDVHNCTGTSNASVTIDLPPLNTTGYTICQGSQVPAGDGFTASGCGDVTTSFAGRTTFQDPTFNRGVTGTTYTASVIGTDVHYLTHTFEVGTSGSYTFTLCGDFDTYLHIYQSSFNPAFPATNFLVADDDAALCTSGSEATLNLTAGVEYVFVAIGYGNNDVGDYTATFSGPGPVYEGPLNSVLWFSQASGGPLVYTGSPFNPVGTATLPNTNTPGTYTFYAACPNTPDCRTPVNFVINPAPTVNLGGPYTQCGGNVTLDAGPGNTTYSWSDGTSAQTTVASTSGNYAVTVSNSFACSASGSADVYIQPVPVVNLGLDVTQCGGNVTLDAGNPGNLYHWSDNSSNQTLAVSTSNNYSVTVTDINSGCTAGDDVNVTINGAPVINLGGPYTQCGGTVTLNAGNAGATYLWSNNTTTQTITVGTSGIYRVTVTNGNTCSATATTTVTINSFPVLGADKSDSVCPGYTVDLNTFYANSGYATYVWNTATPSTAGAGVYNLIVTNAAGCADTAVVTVLTRQHPNLGPDIADSICIGYTYDLWSLYPNSADYVTYVWNTPTPSAVTAGAYTLIVSNASGCSDTLTAVITTRQQPNLGPDNADSVCVGYTLDLTAYYPNNGYAGYTWNTANPDSVGPGVYQLIVINQSGCSDTAFMTVTYRQRPVVTLNMAHEMCYNELPFTLNGGSPVGGIYVVDDTSVTFTFDPVYYGIGIHHINYIYTNASGCTDSASIQFIVHPQPNITTLAPPDLCTGSAPMDLNNYFTPLGGVFLGFGVSQHYFYPSLTGAVDDTITYYYVDQFGCKDTSVYPISVKNSVKVSLAASELDYTICRGDNVTFIASGAEFYEFFVNGVSQGVATTTDSFATTSLSSHDEVYVVGSNSCSTDTSESIFIDVITLPTVTAGPDTTITLGEVVVLNTKATGATQLIYDWTPNYFLNFANVPNPTYSGPDTTTFVVRVTDTYGCWGTDSITINVYVPDNILLPNVLTPDGDGKNDIWKLNSKINLDGSKLIIFNRWGETVYEAENYANNWDGTYKATGKKLPDDTYYYVLKVPMQNNHVYKGAINILNGTAK